jgi:hypothetical protein
MADPYAGKTSVELYRRRHGAAATGTAWNTIPIRFSVNGGGNDGRPANGMASVETNQAYLYYF